MAAFSDSQLTILVGDCREKLRDLPAESVQTIVTSPPYWGLRDYGNDAQLGQESTPEEYVSNMVAVFAEAKRVLREDGTLWLNLGDSYAGSSQLGGTDLSGLEGWNNGGTRKNPTDVHAKKRGIPSGLKAKDLVGIPWRVAFALQADGWYLRSEIIWAKLNPMPESVTDRPTKSHEQIFLLSKSPKYFYDAEAIKEEAVTAGDDRGSRTDNRRGTGYNAKAAGTSITAELRNKRSVWLVPTQPYGGAHFATFPPNLIEPCILAGAPVGGVVLDPFGGSGTTALVANRLGRKAVLIELNEEYVELIKERNAQASLGI
jgi:DNA modification methylase